MKILALDTSTKFLTLGFYDGNKIYAYGLDVGRQLSALITPTIKRALDALGWGAGSIDYFACGLGPGSFTGLRVGLATIKGLAWVAKKPVVGIPTLDILAKGAPPTGAQIVPAVDAKRKLIYCSIYKTKGNVLERVAPYMLLDPEQFFKKVKNNAVILGDASALYRKEMSLSIKGAAVLDSDYWYPKAHNIVSLALERIRDKKLKTTFNIEPIYLYPKECQVRKSE